MPVTACEFESHLAHSFLFLFTLNLFLYVGGES